MPKLYCEICGMEGKKSITRFGKYFCSEAHAEEYVKERRQIQPAQQPMKGGCC